MLLTVSALVDSCGGSPASRSTPSYGSGAGAPTLAEVATLLQRHSMAVLDRSAAAFMADVDPASAAETYRSAQAAEIDALARVPLRSWTYSVSSPVTDASIVKAAATRLGAPTSIVHVSISYALDAVDRGPVTHDLWWTFVQRHGHVYIASDADLSGQGGESWRGPWDFGPIVTQRGSTSLVLGPPSSSGQLAELSAEIDAAVPRVAAVWGTDWPRVVAVVVASSQAEFSALTGQSGPGSSTSLVDISAETVFESSDPSTGGGAGARIILNPTFLTQMTPVGRRVVLQHEITHVATAASTLIATPRWLVEGFADYVGNLDSGQPVVTVAAELRAEVVKGELPSALPSESDFASGTRLAAVYEQAWLACRLIATRAGQAGLVHFYRLVGESDQTVATAVAMAIQSVLQESAAAFIGQWRAYLTAQLS